MGIQVYSLTELFGWYKHPPTKEKPEECLVCGSLVSNGDRHQFWHNSNPMNQFRMEVKPIPKTREEQAAFAKEWDRKVEEDRQRNV